MNLNGVRVLAADDEADARHLIKRILGGCGAIVETAESGATALRYLREDIDCWMDNTRRLRELHNQCILAVVSLGEIR